MPDNKDKYARQQDLADLRAHVDERFDMLRDHLVEKMRDMQTELLRGFASF